MPTGQETDVQTRIARRLVALAHAHTDRRRSEALRSAATYVRGLPGDYPILERLRAASASSAWDFAGALVWVRRLEGEPDESDFETLLHELYMNSIEIETYALQ